MLVPYNEIHVFQHVRKLTLSNCDSLVDVFGSGGDDTKESDEETTHYQLQNLELDNLPKLSHIWKHNITKVASFHNLKVEECEMMEEIITKGDGYIEGGNKVKILFPKLEKLRLVDLPKLECVCSGYYDYDIPLFTVE
ncbi:hypothetical protein P8452_66119 [Trifolium repens]|nr:hypothetical protein P8452_66119 [Trifolium repens]